MAGFGRVHKEGRRAGARQRRGDLAADMAGLADAADDDAAANIQDQFQRLKEGTIEAVDQC